MFVLSQGPDCFTSGHVTNLERDKTGRREMLRCAASGEKTASSGWQATLCTAPLQLAFCDTQARPHGTHERTREQRTSQTYHLATTFRAAVASVPKEQAGSE